ncbi:MAG TPA: FAD-dependent oxidoreductase [Terriglobia bacterium]|nr:FAD-dependent oxidoreductase [Terriglobia bacterium]
MPARLGPAPRGMWTQGWNMASNFNTVVVGAGSFGAWTALTLQLRGRRVLLLDAQGPAHSRASSGGESRIIRMGYGPNSVYTRWAARSLPLWQDLFARTGRPLFHRTGVLWISHPGDEYNSHNLSEFERAGIPHETFTQAELAHHYPQMSLDAATTWGLLEPESGVLLARRAVAAVVDEAIRQGVEYRCAAVSAPVDATATGRGSQMSANCLDALTTTAPATSAAHRISAGKEGVYVFACGPWLGRIFPDLVGDRIFVTRQEVFFFGTPPGDLRFAPLALPTWIDLAHEAYGMPDIEGRGVKVGLDRHGPAFDPDVGSHLPTPEGIEQARQYLARRLPGMAGAPLVESRVCQYANTSSGDFLLDRHPRFQNVWLAGGGSGHGFKHGPAVGEYLTGRIIDHAPADSRFGLETKHAVQRRAIF